MSEFLPTNNSLRLYKSEAISIITLPVFESVVHAGFPRLGHVAHRKASPIEHLPHAEGTADDDIAPDDTPSATSFSLTMSSASSISLRPQLQFLQARFFGAQLSSPSFAAVDAEESDKVENAAALALSSRRESSSIRSAFAFKFFAADAQVVDGTETFGRTRITLDVIDDDDDVVVSVDDFPSKAVVGKRVLSFDTAANAGLFNTPVELSVINPQRTASSIRTFFKALEATGVTRNSPPGRNEAKVLDRRPRRAPSVNAIEGVPLTSSSMYS